MHSIHSEMCAGFCLLVQVHPIGKWQHWKAVKLNVAQTQLNLLRHYIVS